MPCPVYSGCSDQVILGWMQDYVLEPNNAGQSLATNQFTITQLINSLNGAQLDFVRDTGIVNWHFGYNGDSCNGIGVVPETEYVPLPQDYMDGRRRAWIAFDNTIPTPEPSAVTELPVNDSFTLDALNPTWEATLGTPAFSDEGTPAIPGIYLSPQPSDIGQVDLLYTPVPTQLSNTGVPLSVPPDCAIPIFYRALEILFSLQGEGADDQRARHCGEMYNLLVGMVKGILFFPNMQTLQG